MSEIKESVMEFEEFPKIARLSRECTITEKLDGTNASIVIADNSTVGDVANAIASTLVNGVQHWIFAGSRTRWITPEDDNYGFAKWVETHVDELMGLGMGRHFGEWWGAGIQRKYGLTEKRFSLFNTFRWSDDSVRPECCGVVPILYQGQFDSTEVTRALLKLATEGSVAAPGFINPEGIIVYHHAAKQYFKKTILKDEEWKGKSAA